MSDSIDIIILIPGLTGSTLVESQSSIGSPLPLWPVGTLTAATEAATLGLKSAVEDAVTNMAGTLWASRPLGADNGEFYGAFLKSIATQLNAGQSSDDYSVIYTSWPTVDYSDISNTSFDWLQSGLLEKPNKLNGNTLIGWAYDWRQDNLISAKMLQNLLYNLNKDNTIGKITLIGHSMGGIVARGYLEDVGVNDPWFSLIDQFISLGTPNLGAPLALSSITASVPSIVTSVSASADVSFNSNLYPILNGGGWLQAALNAASDEAAIQAAIQQNMQHIILSVLNYTQSTGADLPNPGIGPYQLLPPPTLTASTGESFTFGFIDIDNTSPMQILPLSPFPASQSDWSPMQKSLASIPCFLSNFSSALNLTSNLNYFGQPSVPYNCVYGIVNTANPSPNVSSTTTVTAVTYDSTAQGSLGFAPVETNGGGDTIVPFGSASFGAALLYWPFSLLDVTAVCFYGVDHDNMPNFAAVQTQIMSWLKPSS